MKPAHVITLLGVAVLGLSIALAYRLGFERGSRLRTAPTPARTRTDGATQVDPPQRGPNRNPQPGPINSAKPPGPGTNVSRPGSGTSDSTLATDFAAKGSSPVNGSQAPRGGPGGVALAGAVRFNCIPTGNHVRVEGTSTLHDWAVESRLIGGYVEFASSLLTNQAAASPKGIEAAGEIYIPVHALKSVRDGKPYSNAFDDVMYAALRYSQIKYRLEALRLVDTRDEQPGRLEGRGLLEIAGVTNRIVLPVTLQVRGDTMTFSGEFGLKMTDFGIEPPKHSPEKGVIQAGDAVKVSFSWSVRRRDPSP